MQERKGLCRYMDKIDYSTIKNISIKRLCDIFKVSQHSEASPLSQLASFRLDLSSFLGKTHLFHQEL